MDRGDKYVEEKERQMDRWIDGQGRRDREKRKETDKETEIER